MPAVAWDFRFLREADWLALWIPALAAAAWLLYRSERAEIPRRVRMVLAALRAAAISLVLALLFEPVLAVIKSRSREATVAVLLDTSRSMGVAANEYLDPRDLLAAGRLAALADDSAKAGSLPPETEARLRTLTRLGTAKGILSNKDLGLLEKLKAVHQVRLYGFDAGITALEGDAGEAEGNSTRIGEALRKVASDFRGQPLAGIVLLTDGKTNAGEDPEVAARSLADLKPPVPVYAVGIGEAGTPRDIALSNLAANPVAIKGGDPMTFRATLRAAGFEGQKALVTLSRDGQEVDRQEVALPKDGEDALVTLTHKPQEEGTASFQVSVAPFPGELLTENNALSQSVKVIAEKVKVCFVDERPRWEYRKLKNFLVRNSRLYTSSCLLFSADPAFPQEGSKPIAEFYADYKAMAEAVDVLVLGDVDPSRFTASQMEAIVKFCESGGGVVFVAGEESMPSAWRATPVARILPLRSTAENWDRRVYLDALTESFSVRLTAQGESHPLMQVLDATGEENRRYWEALQGQYWFFPVEQLKPAAVPLAVHALRKTQSGQPFPLAVVMRYGAGQSFFLAFDSTWRWSYGDPNESAFHRFWGRVIQHMAQNRMLGGTGRASVSTDRTEYGLGDRVFILANVVDASFNPLGQETVRAVIEGPDKVALPVPLTRNPSTGMFEGAWTAGRQGSHEIWLDPGSALGAESRRTAFGVKAVTAEFQDPRMDRKALERLAEITGGRFFTLRDLGGLPGQIESRSDVLVTEEKRPLWDAPWVLCLLVGLLSAEWILRKWARLI